MMLALAWLTVSLPYVYAQQQALDDEAKGYVTNMPTEEDHKTNNANNTTEEKHSGNPLSEYLHDKHHVTHYFSLIDASFRCHEADVYIAYHPDQICPPPDFHAFS